jgi:energy-coupling factor transporter ATP-binding protein EcfA2
MIESVHFRNFKGLRDVTLPLERFTVLVGPNASGKTSILQGIRYLSRLRAEEPDEFLDVKQGGPFQLCTRGAGGEMQLAFASATEQVRLLGKLTGPFPEDILHYSNSDARSGKWSFQIERKTSAEAGDEWTAVDASFLNRAVFSAALLRLDVDLLAAPSYVPMTKPQIKDNGEGLPSVLAYMAGNRPDDFIKLQEALRKVIPAVQRLRTDRASVNVTEFVNQKGDGYGFNPPTVEQRRYVGDSLVFDFDGASDIPASMVSDGTLLVLGLLTVILGPGHPQLILLDDLERGLHPKAQWDLVGLLRKILDENPEMQIVATTHSPYILDHLAPREVRLTTRNSDGSVACARLDEHPDFARWKEEMTPGEFWSMVGEKWVAERVPVESR